MQDDVVACPQCGTNLQNSASIAGQVVSCPQCQTQLKMPVPAQSVASFEDLPPMTTGDETTTIQAPVIQPLEDNRESTTSFQARRRRQSNPMAIFFGVVIVMVLVSVGAVAILWDQSQQAEAGLRKQIIGNWELVPGQSQLDRWDFAFHLDGQLQMALGNELTEGRWQVESADGTAGVVSIIWPDDAPQIMRVRFEGGTMQAELNNVGKFEFRAAGP